MNLDWLTPSLSLGLLLLQVPAVPILLSRLLKGPSRRPPVEPLTPTPELLGVVSVVVPTLNEAERINPCLAGLSRQSYEVREIIVVDSNSQDGTAQMVKAARSKDQRFRLITDDPLPDGWVGRPWALHSGFLQAIRGWTGGDRGDRRISSLTQKSVRAGLSEILANSEILPENPPLQTQNYALCPMPHAPKWILGIDADTQPSPGLVAGLVKVAEAEGYDIVSLSPQFILKYPGEWWLQPALLMTLLYRSDPSGSDAQTPERVMANGQCFLSRSSVLAQLGGYDCARQSFCDDVTLARYAAAQGFKVGFLDGAKAIKVRMYEGAAETWREWGRSLDLKDASPPGQVWGDLWLLLAVQALPLPVTLLLIGTSWGNSAVTVTAALGLNLLLLAIRVALLWAIAPSYDRTQSNASWMFWLSPFADIFAVLRIFLSAIATPTQWRGRKYNF